MNSASSCNVPRLARVIIPGFPHHVVQRGNRRQPTFFQNSDYRLYLDLLASWCCKHKVQIWAYCLMTNHVHLIAVPERESGLRLAIGQAHRRYSRLINFRKDWRGHLFQGRFSSYPLDTNHLLVASRYIERNPVDAGIVAKPEDYEWSSAKAHVRGKKDPYITTPPLFQEIGDWKNFLSYPLATREIQSIEKHERTGRPLGDTSFVYKLEQQVGRPLAAQKGGRGKKRDTQKTRMVSPD